MKPVFLLDVDGVLNPYMMKDSKWEKKGFTKHLVRVATKWAPEGMNYHVLLSDKHREMLTKASEVFDVVWATTWGAKANSHLAPLLGLPEYPVLDMGEEPGSSFPLCWKTPAIKAAFSPGGAYEGRAFVWADDDTTKRDRQFFNNAFGTNFHKLLLVNPGRGLTEEEMTAAYTWAEAR